jgi:short-subunit dehydrogenase
MANTTGRTALVTGASRGIGKAVALSLMENGWEVIGTCRDPKSLAPEKRLPGVRYLPLDLSSPRSVAGLARKAGIVDLLVNNAGESPIGPAEEMPLDKVRGHFQVNLFGPLQLTQALLSEMRVRRGGTVIFISSMRGEAPTPFSSLYSASKAAIRSFAGCLRMEVKPFGVEVSVIAPWHIRTTIPQELLMAPRSPYAGAVKRVKQRRDEMIEHAAEPAVVAGAVLKILRAARPRSFYTVGRHAAFQAFLVRHMPRGFVESVSARRFGLSKRP